MHADLLLVLLADQIQDYFRQYGYVGIYVFYITVDQIAPIPEEITLILIGYFVMLGELNPVFAGLFAIAAFITVDTVYFYLTKTGNKFIKKIRHKSGGGIANRYKEKLKKHTLKTLVVLCFIPRMRLLAPVFVALMKFPYRKFVLYDFIGLCIFTTVYISLGIIFHNSLSTLMKSAKSTGNIVFIAATVFMTVATIFIMRKMNKKSAK